MSYGRPESGSTFVEIVADYLRYARGYNGEGPRSTFATMKLAVRTLVNLYGRTLAAQFGPVGFKAIRQTPIEKDLSPGYIND